MPHDAYDDAPIFFADEDRQGGRTKAIIMGIQITISNQHKNTAQSWLASVSEWEGGLEVDEIEYVFCWVMEDFDHNVKPFRKISMAF